MVARPLPSLGASLLHYITTIAHVAARSAAVGLCVCRLNVRLCLRGCADAAVQSLHWTYNFKYITILHYRTIRRRLGIVARRLLGPFLP